MAVARRLSAAHYELNLAQRDIYFDLPLQKETLYHIGGRIDVDGPLDVVLLEHVYCQLLMEIDTLRSGLTVQDHDPRIVVHPELRLRRPILVDFSGELNVDDGIDSYIDALFADPFVLDGSAPLHRFQVLRAGPERHVLVFKCHHILLDGHAGLLLYRRLIDRYNSLRNGGEPPESPTTAPVWQLCDDRGYLASARATLDAAYWADQFATPPAGVYEPLAAGRRRSERLELTLDPAVYERLKNVAAMHQLSAATLLLAALYLMLARHTGQKDICLGVPVLNRPSAALREAAGLCVRLLPIRMTIESEATVLVFCRSLNARLKAAYRHKAYPLSHIVTQSKALGRHGGQLFDVVFSFEQHDIGVPFDGCRNRLVPLTREGEKYPLTVHVRDFGGAQPVVVHVDYEATFWGEYGVESVARQYLRGIERLANGLDSPIMELEFDHAIFDRAFLDRFNARRHELPPAINVVSWFEQRVREQPDAIAVIDESRTCTYGELNRRSNRLAHYLRRRFLARDSEAVVGVMLERSERMMVSLLAIVKAGAAFLPIDRYFPATRIAFLLQDSEAVVVISDAQALAQAGVPPCAVLNLDDIDADVERESCENLQRLLMPHRLAYVMYTSGTTGNPKGVLLEHGGLANRLAWQWQALELSERDVFVQKTTYTFDVSVWEIFMPICFGARLVLCPEASAHNPASLMRLIAANGVTCLHFVPSVLNVFLAAVTPQNRVQLQSLRWIVTSGEALTPATVAAAYVKIPSALVMNLYGPTEATIDVSYFLARPGGDVVYIGEPVWNTTLHILDERRRPVPVGSVGELYIGGVQVARGYLNRPELTRERFVSDPSSPDGQLYRTGDLARLSRNGEIEYLGRIDSQVKIGGVRIELDEITNQLLTFPGVEEATVQARRIVVHGDMTLVAYFVSETPIEASRLRAYLNARLPRYMIPSFFVKLDRLPLKVNGKIDAAALPLPEPDRASEAAVDAAVPPQTTTEAALLEIWRELLNRAATGITDNFFAIGGHSLLAIRMLQRIQTRWGVELSLRDIFNYATVRELAALIDQPTAADGVLLRLIEPAPGARSLFFIPPVSGSATVYRNLALKLLPDFNGYGLQYDHAIAESITALAGAFAHEVNRIQPKGAYVLIGYSMGAKIAFEMAKRMEREGARATLILLDGSPENDPGFDMARARARVDRELAGLLDAGLLTPVGGDVRTRLR
ncbi:MAG: non-ribosomal peptide synthetase, partial [Sulfurifustis sp.]